MLPQRQKVDISSFNDQEKELFQKYGKVPSHKGLLANKLKERKYFDSGDYALSKAGVDPQHSVGTAIPSPADIPHASPPNTTTSNSVGGAAASTSPSSSGGFMSHASSSNSGGPGTSPTSNRGEGVGVGVQIGGGGGSGTFGSPSKEPVSFGGRH